MPSASRNLHNHPLLHFPRICARSTDCASITSGKHQPVSINTLCDGESVTEARCALMDDEGGWYVKSPGSAMSQQAYGNLAVDCKKGESIAFAMFQSKSSTGVWGNILAGRIIGYAVGAGSGAGFDYSSAMAVTMSPPCKGITSAVTATAN